MSTVARHLSIAATVLLVSTTVACGPETEPSEDDQGSPDAPGNGETSDDEPQDSAAQLANELAELETEVAEAIDRIGRQCMEEKGFTQHPPDDDHSRSGSIPEPERMVVLSPDPDEAADDGYGKGETDESDVGPPDDSDDEEEDPRSPEERERYSDEWLRYPEGDMEEVEADSAGRPKIEGCYGEAVRTVFPDSREPQNPASDLSFMHTVVHDDPDVAAALDEWRGCVAEAGYPELTDPADARRYAGYFHHPVGGRPGGPVPEGGPWPFDEARQKEIELAVADAECADEHGLREAQVAAAEAELDERLAEMEAQAVGYRDEMQAALERAQEALEQS